jgi:hypothetical protein
MYGTGRVKLPELVRRSRHCRLSKAAKSAGVVFVCPPSFCGGEHKKPHQKSFRKPPLKAQP